MSWNVGAERLFGFTAVEATHQHYQRFFLPRTNSEIFPLGS